MFELNIKGFLALAITSVMATSLITSNLAVAETVAQNSKANQPAYWVEYFKVSGLTCVKYEPVSTPFIAPASKSGAPIYATIVKAGAGETANEVDRDVQPGDALVHSTGKENSHVIVCYGSAIKPVAEKPKDEVKDKKPVGSAEEQPKVEKEIEAPNELPETGSNKLAHVFGIGSLTSASVSWLVSFKRRR